MVLDRCDLRADFQRISAQQEKTRICTDAYNVQHYSVLAWAW